ncbi:UDP-glucose 4-epimerase GalE [Modestobacter roseus]|uniref:UDP-glucose 4-epimerase n=1 Tax=Modestobacter roseus TaxID=1181884 RepID=A0A562IXJ5_9ACTN|nr:UDP-glucose 4-epimerase GalE [Modestobacter roseus]MQA32716.1 UDP-glucose 4-epimerase GalE [Modestobacter roseus]TWH75708.1 UDP-galactose 4-epimerase [Modestobacter roseus]
MTWLVTGGAGYIGAHVVHAMAAAGEPVVVLDDLSSGDAGRLDGLPGVPLVVGSVRDRGLVRRVLREHAVQGVVHVAGKKAVAESVADPLRYFAENVEGLVALLESCRAKGVGRFVFSSSAAVYGAPDADPVTEDAPCRPLSPYGQTKLVSEWVLRDCATAYGLAATSLRYFNVAGAARPRLGDTGAANLVPMVFAALDAGTPPVVFGDDHATPDGTGVRDYVHVADVATAHLAAARALTAGSAGGTYNVGTGAGCSVRDVLRVVAEVTGADTTPVVAGRRPGDAASVVAAVGRIERELGFRARRGLPDMIASAWTAWRRLQPL